MRRVTGRLASRSFVAMAAFLGLIGLFGSVASGAAGAEPLDPLWQRCDGVPETLACNLPRGIGVSPLTGHLYVADSANTDNRMVELTAWGEFVRAWGWGVADGSEEAQVCTSPSSCKEGIRGAGSGQFEGPQGVAVDSAGNVYVSEFAARRVQKFDSEGNFILMFGGEVNKTRSEEGGSTEAQRNLCTAASGDVCGKGVQGTGDGQFGQQVVASFIAVGSADKVYVGDKGRIQVFSPGGAYLEDLPDPDGVLGATQRVQALATGPGGVLWMAVNGAPGVWKLNATSGAEVCKAEGIEDPSAIATDPSGNLYVFDESSPARVRPARVRQFSSACADKGAPFGEEELSASTGIAAGAACLSGGKADVYVSNLGPDFVRAYGPAPTNEGLCPKPVYPPQILSQFTLSVNSEGADVRASIDPRFYADTTSYVQYGTAACLAGGWPAAEGAGCLQTQPAPPGPPLGAGAIDFPSLTSPVALHDLAAGTEYRYRFVVASKGSEDHPVYGRGGTPGEEGKDAYFRTSPIPGPEGACPNDVYRIGLAARLPDCRAYEMVSPVDKEGADIVVVGTPRRRPASIYEAGVNGQRFTFSAFRSFGDAESASYASQYLAARGGDGWTTQAISPPRGAYAGGLREDNDTEFKAFSPDLCSAWLIRDRTSAPPLTADAPPDTRVPYVRSNCGASSNPYKALLTSPPHRHLILELEGVTAGGETTFIAANDSLTSETPDPGGGFSRTLYASFEADNGGQQQRPVCIFPGGTASVTCAAGSAQLQEPDNRSDTVGRAVSEDGSSVYWSDPYKEPGKLYVRVNPTEAQSHFDGEGKCNEPARACTYPVSAGTAQFWTASGDGSRAFFSDAVPSINSVMSANLEEFDLGAALAGAAEPTRTVAHQVAGVLGASEDASRVYLISAEAIAESGANSEGASAQEGAPNLYLEDEGAFTFIATVANRDAFANPDGPLVSSPVNVEPFRHSSRVTPDGQAVTFMSTAPLTGADNTDINSGEADSEVFRYDARSNQLSCVSCNPSGARPAGRNLSTEARPLWAAAQLPNPESQLYASHVLSDDGTRVFFESFEPLVGTDTNSKQDVYEWEASGAGTCTTSSPRYTPPDEGCLSLISGGESPQDSDLLDATPTGSDVFFRTGASLVGRDPGLFDVYDARVGGGFPEPTPTPPCEGEACQSPPAAPESQTPASSAYHGPGDLPARSRCAAGARRAKRLALRARRTHRAARRLAAGGSAPQARKTAHRARRLSRRARALHRRARRCRRAAHNARRSR